MRVSFVTTYPPANCGIAIYTRHLVDAIKKLCNVNVVPVDRPKANPLYFIGLAMKAKKGADVVHVQYDCGFFGTISLGRLSLSGMYTPLFYICLKAFGVPSVVTTVHELQDARKSYGGRSLYWPMHFYYWLIYKSMVAFSDVVIVHTRGTIETLSQYTSVPNTEIIPLAAYVTPTILPAGDCKVKLGLSGKRVVEMFGFISSPKGHDLAIEAMHGIPDDVVLLIAGDGRTPGDREYVRCLKDRVKSEGLDDRVIFHGYVADDDAPIVVSAADIVLMPYRHVVQSAVLSYMLAYLKPVLASDIGGFAEVARDYGCLETFPEGDVPALRSKLLQLLSDAALQERLCRNAGTYLIATSLDSVAQRTCEVYRKLDDRKNDSKKH